MIKGPNKGQCIDMDQGFPFYLASKTSRLIKRKCPDLAVSDL